MTEIELDKLLGLTMLKLSDDEEKEFLAYFNEMKKLLDELYQFPLPEIISNDLEPQIRCFDITDSVAENTDLITTNTLPEKIKNHAIEIVSHFGK